MCSVTPHSRRPRVIFSSNWFRMGKVERKKKSKERKKSCIVIFCVLIDASRSFKGEKYWVFYGQTCHMSTDTLEISATRHTLKMLCHRSLIPRTEHAIFLPLTFRELKDHVLQNYIGHHQNESSHFSLWGRKTRMRMRWYWQTTNLFLVPNVKSLGKYSVSLVISFWKVSLDHRKSPENPFPDYLSLTAQFLSVLIFNLFPTLTLTWYLDLRCVIFHQP